jgi:sodium-independent sulfate anion transporter 11
MSGPSNTLLLPNIPARSHDDEKYPHISVARKRASLYLKSLFPFLGWIGHYNSTWLASDLIAGITVGAIVVPQGMAYASLAKLDPEFGLYSSFVGVMIYWLFGTSKDISIGPVAVLSTVVGNLINQVSASDPEAVPFVIAATLSISTGVAVLLMGLLRCGWIVNLVSAPALAAFMTGSAITITTSQVPSILGLTGFSNRRSPYEVFMNIITHAGEADVNAILGISALLILYGLRYTLTTAAESSVKHKQTLLLLNSMRAVAVIVVYTLISWLVHSYSITTPDFDVLGAIPRGMSPRPACIDRAN